MLRGGIGMFKKISLLCLCVGLLCGAAAWASAEAITPCDECVDFVVKSDDYRHWEECEVCGTQQNHTYHSVYCNDTTVCVDCSRENCHYSELLHSDELIYHSDKVRHYEVCPLCDAGLSYSVHQVDCSAPTVCVICQYDEAEPYIINHGEMLIGSSDTEHWEYCSVCGAEDWRMPHYATCEVPDVCGFCEKSDCVIAEVEHSGFWEWHSNASDHWMQCSACEQADEATRDTHTEECPNVGVCVICGDDSCRAAQSNGHTWKQAELQDPDSCSRFVCEICSKERVEGEHSFWCTDLTTCYNCGATGLTADEACVYHEHLEYVSDEAGHWQVCADCETDLKNVRKHTFSDELTGNEDGHGFACTVCGTFEETIPHVPYCNDETTCAYCDYVDAQGLVIYDVLHGDVVLRYDNTHHWYECEDCGEPAFDKEEHTAICSNPTVCRDCYQEIADVTVNGHVNIDWANVQTNGTHHWYLCLACGGEAQKDTHIACCSAPTTCDFCQRTNCTVSYVFHDGNYNGYGDGSGSYQWEDLDVHVYLCGWCGEAVETWYHVRDPKTGTTCSVCKGKMACRDEDHIYKYVYVDEDTCIDTCTICGFTYGFAENHVTNEGDPEGVCSNCGSEYGAQAPTPTPVPDAPTPTPVPQPDATPVPQPDVTGEVVIGDLPQAEVKEPTLVLPEDAQVNDSLRLRYEITEQQPARNTITYEVALLNDSNDTVDLPGECTLVFPYPAGMSENDRSLYFITIRHTRSDGVVDVYSSKEGTVLFLKQGLGVKVDTLSPFEITYAKNTAAEALPPTGDGESPWLYLLLLTAAAGALAFMRRKLRRA